MRKPLATTDMIYKAFQAEYHFRELGDFEAMALAATQVESSSIALSTAIVSPPGQAKTKILRGVLSMFPESTYVLVDGAITEYHIAKEKRYEDLNNKLFCLNDIQLEATKSGGTSDLFLMGEEVCIEVKNLHTDIRLVEQTLSGEDRVVELRDSLPSAVDEKCAQLPDAMQMS